MVDELSAHTAGKKTIAGIIDVDDQMKLFDIRDALAELKTKAVKDILELANPEITALTEEKIRAINDISELENIMKIYVRLLPEIAALDIASKSIYEMRMDDIRTDILSGIELSDTAAGAIKSGFNETQHKIVSVPARNVADGRFLANDIRKMGLTKEEASAFIHVRLINENFDTEQDKERYLKITGLGEYLSSDNVVIMVETDMTLETALDSVKQTFGQGTPNDSIAIGDTKDLLYEDSIALKMMKSEDAPIYVWMEGEGIISQLLLAMIEIIANDGRININLGTVRSLPGYNQYIYIPNTKAIDFRTEIEAYERYVNEVLVKA